LIIVCLLLKKKLLFGLFIETKINKFRYVVTFFFEVIFTFFLSLIPAWSDEFENNHPIIHNNTNEANNNANQNNNINALNINEQNQNNENNQDNLNKENIGDGVQEEEKGKIKFFFSTINLFYL